MTPLIEHRRARAEYTILEVFDAGIVLSGQEVKALRGKRANISQAFVKVMSGQAYLINARIEQHMTAAHIAYDPTQSRKLLLHKRQIRQIEEMTSTKGLTAIPLMIGTQGNFIKLRIGIGKGKKQYERKEELRRRDLERESRRELRGKGRG